jgi:multidrug efflux pump subunit AcrA (membrane-fusion protein)
VREVRAKAGDQVAAGDLLAVIDEEGAGENGAGGTGAGEDGGAA